MAPRKKNNKNHVILKFTETLKKTQKVSVLEIDSKTKKKYNNSKKLSSKFLNVEKDQNGRRMKKFTI